ncbi:MAG: 1-deoxy-D-xylulose-5-phosphate synthase N-terminal domain-containing protein, partial [Dermatophilaceae bacterium]
MRLLDTMTSLPALQALPAEQLAALAEEIRAFLVTEVFKTGGHLGPNLGVV